MQSVSCDRLILTVCVIACSIVDSLPLLGQQPVLSGTHASDQTQRTGIQPASCEFTLAETEKLSWLRPVSSSDTCAPAFLSPLFDPGAKTLLGRDNALDGALDDLLGFRDDFCVPVSFGGWHWFNTALGDT
ncbi:MAG: hypothetical protein KDA85_09355, partial [Planctomycetaceae bacterium]|nr:hypothetical protein [Planctomycetaceae bacterium]